MKTLPLMMVNWEDGEGRLVMSVGFCVHNGDGGINDTIILAGSLDAANNAEMVTGNVQEIPMTNVIRKWVMAPEKQPK